MNFLENNKSRRDFIKKSLLGSAALVASTKTNSTFFSNSVRLDFKIDEIPTSSNFSLGVAAGDVTAETALLWTKYEGYYYLKLLLWKKDEVNTPLIYIEVAKSDGGFVHANVNGLNAYTSYQYSFIEVDFSGKALNKSLVGNFKSAPKHNDLVPITLGAVSCTYNAFEPITLEHAGNRKDLDAFLFLGDTTYNDGCLNIHDYRDSWARNLRKDGYTKLRSSTSAIATLDDHEIFNNFDPETVDPNIFLSAMQSFFEHQPINRNEEHPNRIWRKFRWGRTVEVFVLDCRTERKPSTRNFKNAQYISFAQMEWLKNSLSQSDAVFKVILNSVPITNFPLFSEHDRWEGYPAQREEILNFIHDEKISGVLWVAGDLHFASIGKVDKNGPGSKQREILVGPGAQISNPACLPLNFSSQFEWTSVRNNYVTIHFDPYESHVELVYQGGSEDPNKLKINEINEIYRTKIKLGK